MASLTELLAEHGDATYREVLRVPALSLGLFAAAPGHDDVQSPHEVDEVYLVVAGRAVLEPMGARRVRTCRVSSPHGPLVELRLAEHGVGMAATATPTSRVSSASPPLRTCRATAAPDHRPGSPRHG